MFWLLLVLFTVVPAIEIMLFVEIGGRIGLPATLAVVLLTGAAGASLARAQGVRVLGDIQRALGGGQLPTQELVEGALVVFGGALLLTPGFFTDFVGLTCQIPPTRKAMALALQATFRAGLERAAQQGRAGGAGWTFEVGTPRTPQSPPPDSPEVIEATFVEDDD